MRVPYAATVGESSTTHGIVGEWSYEHLDAVKTYCGRRWAASIVHCQDNPVEVTCGVCKRVPREVKDATGWDATALLEEAFQFSHDDASAIVNAAYAGAGFSGSIAGGDRPPRPAEFTTHRGTRRWQVSARRQAFVSLTLVSVTEITRRY